MTQTQAQSEPLVEPKPRPKRRPAPWTPPPEPVDWRAWMASFRELQGRPPRILHIGNVANNGYNNAKVLVEAGFDCDALCYDYYHIMGCPEWEDADFSGMVAEHFFPDWNDVRLNGFERPRWFAQGPRLWAIAYLIARSDERHREARWLWRWLGLQRWLVAHRSRWWYRSTKAAMRRLQGEAVRWRRYSHGTRQGVMVSGRRVYSVGGRAVGRARRAGATVDRRAFRGAGRRVLRMAGHPRRTVRAMLDPDRHTGAPWPLPLLVALCYYVALAPLALACLVLLVLITPFALLAHGTRRAARRPLGAARSVCGFSDGGGRRSMTHRIRRRFFRLATGIDLDALDTPEFAAGFEQRAAELIADFARRFPDRPDQLTLMDMLPYRSVLPLWSELFRRYDAIEAYATDPILPMLCGHRPCVAYEHGTIREIPFDDSPTARLCALAYARANAVVITNPDCREAADRLGVERFVPIPHLIDRKYYSPDIADAGALPPEIRPPYIFSPARHDWDIKGSHILIRAFARIADEFPDLQLVTPAWGGDLARSHELITALGIAHRVAMIDPVNIHNLIRVTRGARALVDQFRFGVFGGIGPTALAVGTPLITHLDHSKSDWWMEAPPYFEAWDEDSCVDALRRALTANAGTLRASLRAWMRRNYWHGQVVDRHAELFATLIDAQKQEST